MEERSEGDELSRELERRRRIEGQLHVTPGLREKHDYHRDATFAGRPLMRLPDRTLVPAERYDEALAAYERRQREG